MDGSGNVINYVIKLTHGRFQYNFYLVPNNIDVRRHVKPDMWISSGYSSFRSHTDYTNAKLGTNDTDLYFAIFAQCLEE